MDKAANNKLDERHRDYTRIASAIQFINEHQGKASLQDCASHLHLSEAHFQKLFSRWAGVSPKQYSRFLQKEYARKKLQDSNTLSSTAYDSQLSGTSRLHDLFIQTYGMTPAQYREQGEHLHIHYGIHPSPFGLCLLAVTERGICKLAFFDTEEERAQLVEELHRNWALAQISLNPQESARYLSRVFANSLSTGTEPRTPLKILLKGSEFQLQVWEALLRIPQGELSSYQGVADSIGKTSASRALASAVARNQIAWLIPCHRVIRQNGHFHHYRWGSIRKQAIIAWEGAQAKA